jgi:hypothetical protein
MKCPHCHHETNKSQILKCSHCGETYERGHFEEYQNLDFLHNWIENRQATLGDHTQSLLAEVEARQTEVLQLLGIQLRPVEQVVQELSLVLGTLARMPAWCKACQLSDETTERVTQHLQRQSHHLQAELGKRSIKLEEPRTTEIFDFGLNSIPTWLKDGYLTHYEASSLIGQLRGQRSAYLVKMSKQLARRRGVLRQIPTWVKKEAMSPTFAQDLQTHLLKQVKIIEAELGEHTVETSTLLEVIQFALQAIPEWADKQTIHHGPGEVRSLRDYLEAQRESLTKPKVTAEAAVSVPKPTPKPAAVKAPPKAKPKPIRPPKPKKPPFDWGKAWERVVQAAVSGALLRGVLYLGAFMIVVSLGILVVRFWDIFPSAVQAAFIFSVPTIFYIAGWLVRAKLKLPQAGGVLTGIGALLIAVDFAAIYQFGGLTLNLAIYWLFTSLICTIAYTLTAWRSEGVFFDYIALIGGGSTILALTFALQLPLEWSIVSMTAYSVLMVIATSLLSSAGEKWRETARATRYLPQLVMPVSLVLVLFVPESSASAYSAAFLLSTIGYGILAWNFPATIFIHAAVGSSIGAIGFALWAIGLPWGWYASAAAVLATPYILIARELGTRLPKDFTTRRSYRLSFYIAGIGLLIIALLAGLVTLYFDLWVGIFALTLTSLVLGSWAYYFRQPLLVALASGLFLVPYSLAVSRGLINAQIGQWGAWLMAAWAGLALVYMSLSIMIKRVEKYVVWFNFWAHILIPSSAIGLVINYELTSATWFNEPTLVALSGIILFYFVSAVIHESGRYPVLSSYVERSFPGQVQEAIFLWPLAILLPIWVALVWEEFRIEYTWLGTTLAILGLVYVIVGQLSHRHKAAYRLPWHSCAYVLGVSGVVVAFNEKTALTSALYIDVALLIALTVSHRRFWEVVMAAVLFVWPFHLTLELSPLTPHVYSLAYALLASCAYIPIGIWLNRFGQKFSLPLYTVGYGMSVLALGGSLLHTFDVYRLNVPWIGVMVPLIITCLYVFSAYYFRQPAFAWASAVTVALAYWQVLTLLHVPIEYYAMAWVGLAFAYMLIERLFTRTSVRWIQSFRLPLGLGAVFLCAFGLAFTATPTMEAMIGAGISAYFPLIFAQAMAASLTFLAAWLYRSRWPLYLEPALAFFPVTLFFIGYAEALIGWKLTVTQYGVIWSVLALAHILLAVLLDPARERYAHGLYLGGYALSTFAVAWTLFDLPALLWTLGIMILMATGSALLAHFNHHHTWDDLISALFVERTNTLRNLLRSTFTWIAGWLIPVWSTLLLNYINIPPGYQWMGLSLSALAFIGLGIWTRRFERTYAWAFQSAAQFYTALALAVSALPTIRFLFGDFQILPVDMAITAAIAIQTAAVVFYAIWAGIYHQRFFAHLASWLSFFPYTLAWIEYSSLSTPQFALPWVGWAAILLVVGFALDRLSIRYAHGPYLAGYLLAIFALGWSIPDRLTNLYVLGATILLALVSHLVVHFGRHRSFEDFVGFVWRKPGTVSRRVARTAFLFYATYAFPVWLTLLLAYHQVPWAWRGLALALVAPLYIAFGLALRRTKIEFTWPLYSAGYALTAIGALVAIEDQALAIYVLSLNTVVYAVSAYIFRQPAWLYLSNTLLPIILLLTLHYNDRLTAPWVSQTFMILAFLYLAAGLWLDGNFRLVRREKNVASYGLPFYSLGYLLSAIALAVASAERSLAIAVFTAGVVLYALSAWTFREALFLYPATWLAAVPYYLGMTLVIPETRWYGLGWLPIILVYILLGRFAFRDRLKWRPPLAAITHPAMPFYLLAYALSISMVMLSADDSLTLTLALTAGAGVYILSTILFRRTAWLYPSLLTAHLALISYFNIQPSGTPAYYISLPLMTVTWLVALIGYWVSRRYPVSRQVDEGHYLFKVGSREMDFGAGPSIGHLLSPSWAQPFLIFAAFDLVIWQAVALFGFNTAIIVSTSFAILLGLLAMLWIDRLLVYGSIALTLLTIGIRLVWAELPFAEICAWVGAIGMGMYLIGLLIEQIANASRSQRNHLAVWVNPLQNTPVLLTTLAVAGTLPFLVTNTTACAAALAFAGALYLAIAYRSHRVRLGYLGTGMLLAAWSMVLVVQDIGQPQLYAIPFGLYLAGIGYFERHLGRARFGNLVQCFGFSVILITSFIQSLNGLAGFPYFLLLIAESLAIFWWGVTQHSKALLFIGMSGSVINVVAQVVILVNVYQVSRWFVTLGVGLVLVTIGVIVERKRESILARTKEWREVLETWD